MDADFVAETEGMETQALEDQLYFFEELESVAKRRSQALREVLRWRYDQQEVSYWFTDFGFVRERSPNGRFKTDRH